MRGSIKTIISGKKYRIIFDRYDVGPTGGRVRKKVWKTVNGTKGEAETELARKITQSKDGQLIEPAKVTVAEWLTRWLAKSIEARVTDGRRAKATLLGYSRIIKKHVAPRLGSVRLQDLRPLDLDAYYSSLTTLSSASRQVHHALINSALKSAVKQGLVSRNVATDVDEKPKKGTRQDVLDHVWTATEVGRFLETARSAGTQAAAFYTLALDTGARRGELASLKWTDLDFETGRLTIQRHLVQGGLLPEFSPTKSKVARTVELAPQTLVLLRVQKKHQAEIKLRNRKHYRDHGLIFAKEWGDTYNRPESLGGPLQVNNIAAREFNKLIKVAGVKRIKFHGMRHTMATLALSTGIPVHVVQRRLGHASAEMTLNIYSHVLPSMQQDAADRLAHLYYGSA